MKSNIDLSKGLVFYEPFNGVSSIINNGGQITGNIEFGNEKGYQYASFDGTNDYINYGNTDKTDVYGAISISAWVYVNLSATYEYYLTKATGTANSSIQFLIYKGNDNLIYGGVCSPSAMYVAYKAVQTVGWHYITLTWTGTGVISIYLDNIKGTDSSSFSGLQNRLGNLLFGTSGLYTYKANIKLSDVRIYNRALSAQEVSLLYKQGLNKMPNNNVGSTKLLFNLNVDKGVISDKTGNTTLTATDVSVVKQGSIYAMKFNGSTSKIDTGSDWIGTKACTVSAWIKPYTKGEIDGQILYNSKFYFGITTANRFIFSRNYSNFIVSALSSVQFYSYMNITVVSNLSGVSTFYLNGIVNGTVNQNAGTPVAGGSMIVGNSSTPIFTFDGLISQLQVWDRVFTAEEVAQVFSSQRKLYGI